MKLDQAVTRRVYVSKTRYADIRYEPSDLVPGKVGHVSIEWTPDVPRKLTKAQLNRYRRARNAALAEISSRTGEAVMGCELHNGKLVNMKTFANGEEV